MKHDRQAQFNQFLALFHELYGPGEVALWRAPARLNILGEHIDYVPYLPTASLPFGSHENEMLMLYRKNPSGLIRGASVQEKFAPFSFDAREGLVAQQQSWSEHLFSRSIPPPHWSNYVRGAVFYVQHQWQLKTPNGFDFVIASSIPPQGGSSSSSALVVLAGAVFREVNELPFTPASLALESAQAEWYVGTRGGALDHLAICLAQRQHAVHIQFANHQTTLVPLPGEGFRWVTFFTEAADKGREVMLAYNERAAVSRLLIPALLKKYYDQEWRAAVESHNLANLESILLSLPDSMLLAEVEEKLPSAYRQCQLAFPALLQERHQPPVKLRSRALHHLGEVKRVAQAVTLLEQAYDPQSKMRGLGELLNETHYSLRDLYEVSTPQVNQLHEILCADTNVLGARLIGGGFGGNVLALTTSEMVEPLLDRVQTDFYRPQNRQALEEGAIMISTPGNGLAKFSYS